MRILTITVVVLLLIASATVVINGTTPVDGSDEASVPLFGRGTSICRYAAECRWHNAPSTVHGRRLDWHTTRAEFAHSVTDYVRALAAGQGTAKHQHDPESVDDESYANFVVAATTTGDRSPGDRAVATLVSNLIPCQKGDGHLVFEYFTSPLVVLKVCTTHIVNNFSDSNANVPSPDYRRPNAAKEWCQVVNTDLGPGPVNITVPAQNDGPFQIYIIAYNYVYAAGGYAILGRIYYDADFCHVKPPPAGARAEPTTRFDVPHNAGTYANFVGHALAPFGTPRRGVALDAGSTDLAFSEGSTVDSVPNSNCHNDDQKPTTNSRDDNSNGVRFDSKAPGKESNHLIDIIQNDKYSDNDMIVNAATTPQPSSSRRVTVAASLKFADNNEGIFANTPLGEIRLPFSFGPAQRQINNTNVSELNELKSVTSSVSVQFERPTVFANNRIKEADSKNPKSQSQSTEKHNEKPNYEITNAHERINKNYNNTVMTNEKNRETTVTLESFSVHANKSSDLIGKNDLDQATHDQHDHRAHVLVHESQPQPHVLSTSDGETTKNKPVATEEYSRISQYQPEPSHKMEETRYNSPVDASELSKSSVKSDGRNDQKEDQPKTSMELQYTTFSPNLTESYGHNLTVSDVRVPTDRLSIVANNNTETSRNRLRDDPTTGWNGDLNTVHYGSVIQHTDKLELTTVISHIGEQRLIWFNNISTETVDSMADLQTESAPIRPVNTQADMINGMPRDEPVTMINPKFSATTTVLSMKPIVPVTTQPTTVINTITELSKLHGVITGNKNINSGDNDDGRNATDRSMMSIFPKQSDEIANFTVTDAQINTISTVDNVSTVPVKAMPAVRLHDEGVQASHHETPRPMTAAATDKLIDELPHDVLSRLRQLFAQKCVDPRTLRLSENGTAQLVVVNSMYVYADAPHALPPPRQVVANIAAHFQTDNDDDNGSGVKDTVEASAPAAADRNRITREINVTARDKPTRKDAGVSKQF